MESLGLDVKTLARQRGTAHAKHALPPQVLAFTQRWLSLAGRTAPRWSQFDMMTMIEVVPFMTILRCHTKPSFTFDFMGSSVSSLLGADLSGLTVSRHAAVLADMDWFRRCKPVAEVADVQVLEGTLRAPHSSPVEFVAADFPFMDEAGGAVSHIVGITAAKLN